MNRNAIKQLIEWKYSSRRKPLVLKGARQVGKTWIMKEFGKTQYEKFFYLSFDEETQLAQIFDNNKNALRIIDLLSAIVGEKILPEKHLLIFDEIQECPNALNSLKYFNEEANEYHVIAAGSLLGTLLANPKSYPVGKVNLLNIYPMSFFEFLEATEPALFEYVNSTNPTDILEIFHNRLIEQYYKYLIIGGMPECVSSWITQKDVKQVSNIQKELIELYESDFSKYNGKVNAGRILLVFRSLVTQLSKSNEKFIYGCVKNGARAREFEETIEWLVSSGLVIRVYNVKKPLHPLKTYEDLNSFKLFFFDVGLLKYLAGISNQSIILNEDFQFKGVLTENFIFQQFQELFEVSPHYFNPFRDYEVDCILQNESDIIPIECKSGKNVLSASFKRYIRENTPKQAIRLSLLPYKKQETMTNIPLYLANKICEFV